MISVNTHQAKSQLSALLAEIEQNQETVLICRSGKPIAEMRSVKKTVLDPLQQYPELSGTLFYDPMEPADEVEWPEDAR